MKQLILILCIVLASLTYQTQLQAQSFSGGFQAGLVSSQVAGDLSSGYNKIGFFATAYTQRQFTLKSAFRLGISFTQKGSRESEKESKQGLQYLLRTHFIEVPLLYLYQLNNKLILKSGLAYAYLVGTPHEEAFFAPTVANKTFHRNSLNFIVGFEYFIGQHIALGIESNNSITPIRPHESGAKRLFNRGQYSDALLFGLSYHF